MVIDKEYAEGLATEIARMGEHDQRHLIQLIAAAIVEASKRADRCPTCGRVHECPRFSTES